VVSLAAALNLLATVAQAISVTELRCEYRQDPLGMDIAQPRLSWVCTAPQRGERQTAWQVQVASTAEQLSAGAVDLWDSGKTLSGQSAQIAYAGKPLASRQRCYWRVRVWDRADRPSAWSQPALWTMGLLRASDWHAQWIGSEEGKFTGSAEENLKAPLPTPRYLRKGFRLKAPIRRATVYVTALGLYELRLNGERVGDHLLAPEWTRYSHRVQVDSFDVTRMLHPGDNAIGALLGNGWYCGMFMCWPQRPRIFGDRPWLLAQLEVETADGQRHIIASDETWRVTTEGALRQSGIYEGETYDAQRELPGWDRAGFDDSHWQPATLGRRLNVGQLVWQRSEPIRVTQEFQPVALTEPAPGVYVFDLGQNIAGWARLTAKAPAGTVVRVRHAEVLNADGTIYTNNLRGARAVDCYTFRGSDMPEVFEPHFTYHGFRCVEVSGLPARPATNAILGRMFHTSFSQAGHFECSNPLLNRLAQSIQMSQRANAMGVPTDCPNRDERTGCTGDHQFFLPTAVYNMDVAAFFNKWLVDLCQDSQSTNGVFADVAPFYGMWPGLSDAWGDAGIICPWQIYRTYGDTRVIVEHYAAMQRHYAYLERTATNHIRHLVGPGDWLNLGGSAKNEVLATAYYAWLTSLMSEMAQAIGRSDDAARYQALAEQIKAAFQRAFVRTDGSIEGSSQSAFALAFTMGLTPPELRQKMTEAFVKEVERFKYHPATGFIGIPRLLPALHEAGRDDVACRVLFQETYPSLLFMVKQGATTIWERWDSFIPGKGFQDPGMNSFNHVVWGSMGEYLFGMLGGIRAETPGYEAIRIQPVIPEQLQWASTRYRSLHGEIRTAWRKAPGQLTLNLAIPVNTAATVFVPAPSPAVVHESGKPAAQSLGVHFLRYEAGAAAYRVESGSYSFTVAQ
jgi:alpha-L-rhamnosidase